jgi:phenylalanyl-tRNA synthetase alpha chain
MEELLQQIESYKQEITNVQVQNQDELEAFRIKFLGTKGIVKSVMGEMRNIPNDNRKEFGLILNAFKILTRKDLKH